jgi:hypothetical protein
LKDSSVLKWGTLKMMSHATMQIANTVSAIRSIGTPGTLAPTAAARLSAAVVTLSVLVKTVTDHLP